MNSSWLTILPELEADGTDTATLHFGDSAAQTDGPLCAPLTGLSVIRARGADAMSFLQNQLSHDLRDMEDGHSKLAAYCTPKGRMLAIVRLVRRGDDYLLLIPGDIAAGVLKRLKMFVMRAKLSLEDVSTNLLVAGISGAGAAAGLVGGSVAPEVADRGARLGDSILLRLPSVEPRYLLIAPTAAMAEHWRALAARVQAVPSSVWRLLDIRDGLPQILGGTQEAFVPQMANLDLVNGLSFNKGCYPGQEIVARMHFLGSLKRRMYRFRAEGIETPAPGTEIRDAGDALAGQVVMAAGAADGAVEGLAVLRIDAAETGALRLGEIPITVTPPPYPLTP